MNPRRRSPTRWRPRNSALPQRRADDSLPPADSRALEASSWFESHWSPRRRSADKSRPQRSVDGRRPKSECKFAPVAGRRLVGVHRDNFFHRGGAGRYLTSPFEPRWQRDSALASRPWPTLRWRRSEPPSPARSKAPVPALPPVASPMIAPAPAPAKGANPSALVGVVGRLATGDEKQSDQSPKRGRLSGVGGQGSMTRGSLGKRERSNGAAGNGRTRRPSGQRHIGSTPAAAPLSTFPATLDTDLIARSFWEI